MLSSLAVIVIDLRRKCESLALKEDVTKKQTLAKAGISCNTGLLVSDLGLHSTVTKCEHRIISDSLVKKPNFVSESVRLGSRLSLEHYVRVGTLTHSNRKPTLYY